MPLPFFNRKPTLADIYVRELQGELDHYVALYPPDSPDISIGTIGRYDDDRRFDRRGHLSTLLGEEAFVAQVPLTEPTSPSTLAFHSEDAVHLEPQGTVKTPLGQDLLKGKLSFTGNRAVVASFAGVIERQVKEPRQFDKLLWQLFLEQRLAEDEVVVWACRTAATGTVLVNRKGGVEVDVTVDPALVAGVLSWQGLGVGVGFGTSSQASAQLSGTNLVVGVRSSGLSDGDVVRIEEVRGFEGEAVDPSAFDGVPVPELSAVQLLAGADFDTPED